MQTRNVLVKSLAIKEINYSKHMPKQGMQHALSRAMFIPPGRKVFCLESSKRGSILDRVS